MDADVIIVGGGLNGPALALALAREGVSALVIDALPETARGAEGFDGRAYALALASRRLLGGIGLWDTLAPDAQPIREIKVTDGRPGEGPGPFWMHFGEDEIPGGPMGHMVEDRHLRPALLAALAATPGVATRSGATVVAQRPGPAGVEVDLDSGETLRARLLVGADGRGSGTAARAGIGRMDWGYDQRALVCAVSHERDHAGVAHQFFMPGGPLAILPLTGRRSSIVWSEAAARAERLAAADDATFLDALRPAFGSFLGEIALAGGRFSYPLGLSLADSLVAVRVALVGDAGHGVHPLAGQGLNAGLRHADRHQAVGQRQAQRVRKAPAFGSFLGEIELAGGRFSYPLGLSLADSLVAVRVALVGDAGHGVHPLAGQGLNAGLRDVAALSHVLGDARRRGEDLGAADVLARYARWRRFDVATLAFATDGFNRLFSNDNSLLRAARDLGMGLVGAVPWLRRAAIREAAGLSGELPRLMR